jgi:hypothetical protein
MKMVYFRYNLGLKKSRFWYLSIQVGFKLNF